MSNKGEYLSIRLNSELKEDFIKFCNTKKLSQTSVLYYFIRKSLDEGKLPFSKDDIYMLECKSSNGDKVSNINIRISNSQMKKDFKELCLRYGLPMAGAVKLFFGKCISTGDFPF